MSELEEFIPGPIVPMPLPNQFAFGQLFACSGIERENQYMHDWCGILTGAPGEICFTSGEDRRMLLRFSERDGGYDVVLSDLILADDGGVVVTFADAQTIVGRTDCMPAIRPENGAYTPGDAAFEDGDHGFALVTRRQEDAYRFALCRRETAQAAQAAAQTAIDADVDAPAFAVLDWYSRMPLCPDPRYAPLWYKCISVNRVNVFSAQDGVPHRFTVPNRLSRRDMRPSDACFHAITLAHYDPALARDAILSVLECLRDDGSLPFRMDVCGDPSDITHLPALCMAIWYLFEVTGDKELLQNTKEALERCIEWDLANRRSPSGLMTWYTEGGGDGELLRPDRTEKLEALDYSVFMANEMKCMNKIHAALGDLADAMRWDAMSREMIALIDERLWDARSNCYFDRTWDGEFRRVLTPASFLPMFTEMCDPRRARMLVSRIESMMSCEFPLPSAMPESGGNDAADLRQSGVRILSNYFVYIGLLRYGYGELAARLRAKTIEGVDKQFRASGNVFAGYDPRGGDLLPQTPDLHTRPATDCNLSACFIQMFLRG